VDGTSKWPRVVEQHRAQRDNQQNRALRHNLGAQKHRDRCSSTPGNRVARASTY